MRCGATAFALNYGFALLVLFFFCSWEAEASLLLSLARSLHWLVLYAFALCFRVHVPAIKTLIDLYWFIYCTKLTDTRKPAMKMNNCLIECRRNSLLSLYIYIYFSTQETPSFANFVWCKNRQHFFSIYIHTYIFVFSLYGCKFVCLAAKAWSKHNMHDMYEHSYKNFIIGP